MKKIVFILALAVSLNADFTNLLKQGAGAIKGGDYKSLVSSALNSAVSELSKSGFANNALAKIELPKSLAMAANLSKKVGGEKWASELTSKINEAATKAVPSAANVFSDTIKNINESDLQKIMSGGSDSFSKFLQENSSKKLEEVFKPIISQMMSQSSFANAYNSLNSFVKDNPLAKNDTIKGAKNLANQLGFGEFIPEENQDLNSYITSKTLEGLFKVMGQKESALRGGNLGNASQMINKILKK